MMAKYKYGMRLRGFAPGCQPMNGFIERQDDPNGNYWGVLVYDRKLTDQEIIDYELDELKAEEPQVWWIFTFGYGQPNAGHYVRIFGTFYEARQEMIRRYGKQWAFQYEGEQWLKDVAEKPWIPWKTELQE